ncbi:unnamed protein product [Gadus morhua 'NCC']
MSPSSNLTPPPHLPAPPSTPIVTPLHPQNPTSISNPSTPSLQLLHPLHLILPTYWIYEQMIYVMSAEQLGGAGPWERPDSGQTTAAPQRNPVELALRIGELQLPRGSGLTAADQHPTQTPSLDQTSQTLSLDQTSQVTTTLPRPSPWTRPHRGHELALSVRRRGSQSPWRLVDSTSRKVSTCSEYRPGLELWSEIEEVVVLGAVVVRLLDVGMEVAVTKVVFPSDSEAAPFLRHSPPPLKTNSSGGEES